MLRYFTALFLLFCVFAAGADVPRRAGWTAGAELGIGTNSFSWVEGPPSSYSLEDDAIAVLASMAAGVWISPSFRLLAQVPALKLLPATGSSRPETVAALLPGAQVSYHFSDSPYYLLFSLGWMVTLNTDKDAGGTVVQGPVFGGGVGYWLSRHVSIKAEADFSSVQTELDGAKTTVKHLVIWASLGVFR